LLSFSIVGEQSNGIQQVDTQSNELNFIISLYNTFLLKRGQDIDDFSDDLKSKLEYEILNLEIMGIISDMVKRGITFTSENRHGNTSLHYIIKEKPLEYIKMLVELGLDFSVKDNNGCNCSFIALKLNRIDIFELLCDKGFDPIAPFREIFLLFKM